MKHEAIDIEEMSMLLGGPLRLVERVQGAGASQCILIRGGPGVGKSIVATYMATKIAASLSTNVAYACVELLPLELRAQQEVLDATNGWSVVTPEEWSPSGTQRILAAALDLGERIVAKDTQEAFGIEIIEVFERARAASEHGVRVVVIDSVSADYGLGGRDVPRHLVDAVAKFAAVNGIVVIVIEETHDLAPSPWSFASDTVIEIDGSPTPDGGRRIRVAKNRFGEATNAYGELNIIQSFGPLIYAPLSSYMRVFDYLIPTEKRKSTYADQWPQELESLGAPDRGRGALVLVEGASDAPHAEAVSRWVGRGRDKGPLVELHYGSPFDVPLETTDTGMIRAYAAPLGIVSVRAEVALDRLRSLIKLVSKDERIAAVYLIAPRSEAGPLEDFLRVLDAVSSICVRLRVPLVCSVLSRGRGNDAIAHLLRSAAALRIVVAHHNQGQLELHCETKRDSRVIHVSMADVLQKL